MKPKVDSNLLDPTTPSGRDTWWGVMYGFTISWKSTYTGLLPMMTVEDYIVARAEAGCPDCISAIMECPTDPVLLEALKNVRSKP